MKKYFWLWMLVLCAIGAHAQSPRKLDSLRTILAQLPPEGSSYASDTMRVRVLCEVGEETTVGNIDSTIQFLEKPLQLSRQLNWGLGLCKTYYLMGYLYLGKNEVIKGIDYLYKSLAIAEKHHLRFYEAKNHKTLGDGYSVLGSFEKAKKHLQQSATIFKALQIDREYLLALNNLGLVYYDAKDYKTAIKYFEECIEKNKYYRFNGLDVIFFANGGSTYKNLGNYDKSLSYLEKVDQIFKHDVSEKKTTAQILNLIFLAELWILKNNSNKSLLCLKKAEKLDVSFGNEVTRKLLFESYYKHYKNVNNKSLALTYYEKYIELDKMTFRQEQENKIQNLQASFDNEKKTSQISLLTQNIQQETLIKNIFIGGVILLLAFSIWFWQVGQKLAKKNKIIEQQQSELLSVNNQLEDLNYGLEQKVVKRTAELQAANETLIKKNEEIVLALVEGQTLERKRVATELHDNLGATLSAIKWRLEAINDENLSEKEQKIYKSTVEMMRGAYSEVRLISHNLLPAELEKGGFGSALEKFIGDINGSGKLQITYDLASGVIPTDKKVQLELYGIALELINNLLKHSQAKNAHVALYQKQSNVIFEISDDGIGLDLQQQSSGMGTKNIQNRVEALNGAIIYQPQRKGLKVIVKFEGLV